MGPDTKLIVTFGIEEGRVREAFCSGFRATSDICDLANDACIMVSLLLQHGVSIAYLADACMENRVEGTNGGRPGSLIGAITREGDRVEKIIQADLELNIKAVEEVI